MAWVRIEAPLTFSGTKFVYKNAQTGELSMDLPEQLQQLWSKRRTRDGELVYIHRETGEVSEDPPPIVHEYDDNDSLRLDAAKQRMVNRINSLRAKVEQGKELTPEEEEEIDFIEDCLRSETVKVLKEEKPEDA